MRKLLCVVALASVICLSILFLSAPSQAGTQSATNIALAQVGEPYVYGADGPGAFDCSGLVKYSFSRAGYSNIPRTADAQSNRAHRISRSDTRRGDLLFYYNRSGHVYHVAIYLGNGRAVEASSPSTGVKTGPVWQAPHFSGTMR